MTTITEQDLTVADTFMVAAVSRLAAVAIAADPALAPDVASGDMHVLTWFYAREPKWRRVLLTADGDMLGYIGVATSSDGQPVVARLLVDPDRQHLDLAQRLIDLAVTEFGHTLVVPR